MQRRRALIHDVFVFSCSGNDLPTNIGGYITIAGTNFSPNYQTHKATVTLSSDFGLSDCTIDSPGTCSTTRIVCRAGAGAGQFEVQVTVASQQSSWVVSTVKYVGPSVSTITPNIMFNAGGGDMITVSGTVVPCRLSPDLIFGAGAADKYPSTHCAHCTSHTGIALERSVPQNSRAHLHTWSRTLVVTYSDD